MQSEEMKKKGLKGVKTIIFGRTLIVVFASWSSLPDHRQFYLAEGLQLLYLCRICSFGSSGTAASVQQQRKSGF